MAALLAALLVACAARAACAQATGTVSSLAELQAAVTAGGAWTVVANLTLAGALTFSGGTAGAGGVLSLTGDADACGGLCWLDAAFVGGHFVVAPGATLQLRGLKLVQALRGYDNACAPPALDPRGGHTGAACVAREHARACASMRAEQRHDRAGARGWHMRSVRVKGVRSRELTHLRAAPGGDLFRPYHRAQVLHQRAVPHRRAAGRHG
jgi:hypothetical protein